MPFDYKKECRELYLPGTAPALVTVPPMNYAAVEGAGDPNEEGGAYKAAVGVLYAVAYTIRMSAKGGRAIRGFFDYVVPPLEGFWRQDGRDAAADFDYGDKAALRWISAIRLPDFVTPEDLDWAVETAGRKKGLDCSAARWLTVEEGLCVQMMHLGPYDDEPASLARMRRFAAEQGCREDLGEERLHHEIYLSDPRRADPARWRTVLRHPVRRL